jgi:aspartate/methionine/tyrosine aminotransferase
MDFVEFDLKVSLGDFHREGGGLSLSSSYCEPLSPSFLLEGQSDALQRFLSTPLTYPAPGGSGELRQAALRFARVGADAEIVLCNGADDGMVLACLGLLSPLDRVIVQTPCYQAWMEIPRALGCHVESWSAEPGNYWRPDLDSLFRLLSREHRPRALIISTPCNPTGFAFSGAELDEIRSVTERHGCLLLIDRVHSFSGSDGSTIAANEISLGSCSKALGLPGLRLGWLTAGNAELGARLRRAQSYLGTYLHPAAEFLGTLALARADEILARNRTIVARNLVLTEAFLDEHSGAFGWVPPMEGCVAVIEYLQGEAVSLARHAGQSAGIYLAAGPAFQLSRRFFRLGFGTNAFGCTLEKFRDFLAKR